MKALLLLACAWSRLAIALPDFTPIDGHTPNSENIYFRDSESFTIAAVAPTAYMNAWLASQGLDKKYMAIDAAGEGMNMVILSATDYRAVKGCTCPNAFKEVVVYFPVAPLDPKFAGRVNAFLVGRITDNATRQGVLVSKFRERAELARLFLDFDTRSVAINTAYSNRPIFSFQLPSLAKQGASRRSALEMVFHGTDIYGKNVPEHFVFTKIQYDGFEGYFNPAAGDALTITDASASLVASFLQGAPFIKPFTATWAINISQDQTRLNSTEF